MLKIQDQSPYQVFKTESTDTELGLSSGNIKWMRSLRERIYRYICRRRKEKKGSNKEGGDKEEKEKRENKLIITHGEPREAGCLPN